LFVQWYVPLTEEQSALSVPVYVQSLPSLLSLRVWSRSAARKNAETLMREKGTK
jgi:hypothetical protein